MRGAEAQEMGHFVEVNKNTLTHYNRMVRLMVGKDLQAKPRKIGGMTSKFRQTKLILDVALYVSTVFG